MNIEIKIEKRVHNGKEVDCYIPKIDGIDAIGGYILKNSVDLNGKVTDNYSLAESMLDSKIKEINEFLQKNGKFLKQK